MKSKTLVLSGSLLLVLSLLAIVGVIVLRGTAGFGQNAPGTIMMAGAGLAGLALLALGIMRRKTH